MSGARFVRGRVSGYVRSMRSTFFLAAALLVLVPSITARATVVTEPPDLSNTVETPTPITLTNGSNAVSGTIETPGDRQDNFTVTVPTGHQLTAVSLRIMGGGFVGSVTFNLSEVRTTTGAFTMGLPLPAGTYYVQVVTDFSTGTTWSMSFSVRPDGVPPVCGDGAIDAGEACDDGNTTECDGCSTACAIVLDGCQIEGTCFADTATHPTNDCAGCVPERSRTAWSPLPRDRRCDDGAFCTTRDACDGAGVCAGSPLVCDDDDACTTDACDDAMAMCTATPIAGCGADAAIELDAGAEADDAGSIDSDAGGVVDGGAVSDAGRAVDAASITVDAASASGADAGTPTTSGGCGCRLTDRRASASLWASLIAIAIAARRRRDATRIR